MLVGTTTAKIARVWGGRVRKHRGGGWRGEVTISIGYFRDMRVRTISQNDLGNTNRVLSVMKNARHKSQSQRDPRVEMIFQWTLPLQHCPSFKELFFFIEKPLLQLCIQSSEIVKTPTQT